MRNRYLYFFSGMLQKIVVFTTLEESDIPLMVCGVRVASVFRKELCLFYQAAGAAHSLDIDRQLEEYRRQLHREWPALPVSVIVAPFRGERLATTLADEHEAVMLIAGASRFRQLSRALHSSPVPFLFANEKTPFHSDFRKIVFPVDLRPQNKDAMKWALWFGKHNQSEIVAIGANDPLKQDRQQVTSLLAALKNLLTRAGVAHKIYKGNRSSLSVHNEGLAVAQQVEAGLFLLLGSSTVTLLDLLLGLPEEKIVKHAGNIPVLVVNPRRETYLVCE
ncbi:MAG TPA: universal stress protein [Prolixibacteraceae bacterium]|nr:universal stress protein [Prolixibacteraceae bacterium]